MTPKNDVLASCFNLRLRRVARAVTRHYDSALAPTGLTSGQFSVLTAFSQDPVPTLAEASERLGMDRTTLLAALKPLQRQHILEITVDPSDRRKRHLALTAEGHVTYQRALGLWQKAQSEIERRLPEDLQKPLDESLSRLVR